LVVKLEPHTKDTTISYSSNSGFPAFGAISQDPGNDGHAFCRRAAGKTRRRSAVATACFL
jgi:hypothetical protein